jgi:copper chaperone CopZ
MSIRYEPQQCSQQDVARQLRGLLDTLPPESAPSSAPAAAPLPGAKLIGDAGKWADRFLGGTIKSRLDPVMKGALTEKASINFLNDVLMFYLIKIHWDLITKRWMKEPLKHADAWLTTLYLIFLLIRTGRASEEVQAPARRPSIAHRLRVVSTSLAKQRERCYILEILLRKHPAISGVRVVAEIGSVVVHFDPARLPEERLLATLDAVIGNIVSAPPPKPGHPRDSSRRPAAGMQRAVEGMTCASCALLIEMSLQRDPRVQGATVNFAAGTATVKGHLSRDELFASVKKLGYEPRPMDTLAQRRLVVEREKEACNWRRRSSGRPWQ